MREKACFSIPALRSSNWLTLSKSLGLAFPICKRRGWDQEILLSYTCKGLPAK